jgi:hypothetical protein
MHSKMSYFLCFYNRVVVDFLVNYWLCVVEGVVLIVFFLFTYFHGIFITPVTNGSQCFTHYLRQLEFLTFGSDILIATSSAKRGDVTFLIFSNWADKSLVPTLKGGTCGRSQLSLLTICFFHILWQRLWVIKLWINVNILPFTQLFATFPWVFPSKRSRTHFWNQRRIQALLPSRLKNL